MQKMDPRRVVWTHAWSNSKVTRSRCSNYFRVGVGFIALLSLFVFVVLYQQLWIVHELLKRYTVITTYSNGGNINNGLYNPQRKEISPLYNPGHNENYIKSQSERNIKVSDSYTSITTRELVRRFYETRRHEPTRLRWHPVDMPTFHEEDDDLAGPPRKMHHVIDSHPARDSSSAENSRVPRTSLYDDQVYSDFPRVDQHARTLHTRERRVSTTVPNHVWNLSTNPRDTPASDDDTRDSRGSHDTRESRVNVMIFAYLRSGSSFLGEMFNRNPEVFYLFEPFHPLEIYFDTAYNSPLLYDTLVRHLLDDIYTCSFSKHPLFVNTLSSSGFRLRSEALRAQFCDPRATSDKMHLCQKLNSTLLTQECSTRPLTVVKTIRMKNWENIDFLTKSNSTKNPLKVIYLVRDPRAILASRVSWFLPKIAHLWRNNDVTATNLTKNETAGLWWKSDVVATNLTGNAKARKNAMVKYVRISAAVLCRQMEYDIKSWKKRAAADTGNNTFALIRYEDAAGRPLDAYNTIYEFVGAAKSDDVRIWLERNTKGNWDPDYYSTTRNSSATAHMWRQRLPLALVKEVQTHCGKVLSMLGYKQVRTDRELRDNARSLVIKWDNETLVKTS